MDTARREMVALRYTGMSPCTRMVTRARPPSSWMRSISPMAMPAVTTRDLGTRPAASSNMA